MMKKLIIPFLSMFLLFSCGDSCPDCLNDGICIDSVCQCDGKYEGVNCETEKTPTNVIISQIRLNEFPSINENGTTWDLGVGDGQKADPYFVIFDISGNQMYSSTFFENADAPKVFDINFFVEPRFFTAGLGIALVDNDVFSEPDVMGFFIVDPYERGQNFPSQISATSEDGKSKIILFVNYSFI